MSTNVFASKIVTIKTLTNPTLDSANKNLVGLTLVTHAGMKKVIELKGKGTTPQEIRENAVAQALHTVCGFFDEGVSIGLNTKDEKGTLNAITDLLDNSDLRKEDADYKTLALAVSNINKQVGVELYSGSAGGNNTSGTVLGFYDVKNNEIAVFASTNCGSDD